MATADNERSLSWLHLTDLHVGQPREGGRLANIERAFLDDLEKVVLERRERIRIIFFSGDIAFRGTQAEFVRATAMLGRLCNRIRQLNLQLDREEGRKEVGDATPILVPVPGNHDLVRPTTADAETIRTAFAAREPWSPPLWEEGLRGVQTQIGKAFEGYSTWLRRHPLPFPPGMDHGVIPGDIRATIHRDGVRVGVLGLNSAYLHLGDDGPGGLHLDLSQVTKLLGGNPRGWVESHDFCVLMTHHPPSWLSPRGRMTLDQEIKPDALFDLHLFGHEHAGSHRQDPGSSGIRHLVEGRSLFGAEEGNHDRTHGYVLGRFVCAPPDGIPPGASGAAPRTQKRAYVVTRQGWRDAHGWRFGAVDEKWGSWHLRIELGQTSDQVAPNTPAPFLDPLLGDLSVDAKRAWGSMAGTALDAAIGRQSPRTRWILLSASVPYHHDDAVRRERDRHFVDTARPAEIHAFVRRLAQKVAASRDLGILFGGHPTITQTIAPVLLENRPHARDRTPSRRWLVLLQDEHYWTNLVDDVGVLAAVRKLVAPVLMRTDGKGEDLKRMRLAMTTKNNLVAGVFVGGMKGVVDEFTLLGEARPGVPRFCVGLGGGAAAELLLDGRTAGAAMGAHGDRPPLIEVAAHLWHTPEFAVDAILGALELDSPPL